MAERERKTEFYLPLCKVRMVSFFKQKIERMYDIKLHIENVVDDGQWVAVIGENRDRRNAKDYIIALCQPSEVQQIQLSKGRCEELTDIENLEQIEKKTNAVIKPLKNIAEFEISGTELAVTLAMSKLEELAGDFECEDLEIDGTTNLPEHFPSPDSSNASQRLSTTLQRALSQHSDGHCSVDDYKEAPDAVKRVLVNCLHVDDIDEELLFAEDEPFHHKGWDSTDANSAGKPAKIVTPRKNVHENVEMDGPSNAVKSPEVGNLTDKLTEAVIATNLSDSQRSQKQHDYLKSFGESVGYQKDEITEALEFVDEKTRPSDFLELLKNIKDRKSSIRSQEEQSETNTRKCPPVNADSADSEKAPKVTPLKTDLPEGYKARLLMDFHEEDDSLPVEELKKRSAERQKLLKKHFQEQEMEKKKGAKQANQQARKQNSHKSRKNSAKTIVADQKPQSPQRKDSSLPQKKQSRIESCDMNGYEKDDDQTCVFKVWKSEDDSGQWCSPKRKQASGQNCKQGFNTPPTQGTNQYNQGNAQKQSQTQQWKKPVQLVTPNNVARTAPLRSARETTPLSDEDLRYIVIDGSNVAMTHGNGKVFSCKGLQLCVEYFKQRGHKKITVFVPQWRTCRPSDTNPIADQEILYKLKEAEYLVFTPSRHINRKLVASYDDRFILELAEAEDGIIVSNDQYRDLMREKASWRKVVEERLLMFSFVKDRFMPPSDPLGHFGPTLDEFLQKPRKEPSPVQSRPPVNYPTYPVYKQQPHAVPVQHYSQQNAVGQAYPVQTPPTNKAWSVPIQQRWPKGQNIADGASAGNGQNQVKGRRPPYQKHPGHQMKDQKLPLRSEEETQELLQELKTIFPEPAQEQTIRKVLSNHESDKDLAKLTNYCMSVLFS